MKVRLHATPTATQDLRFEGQDMLFSLLNTMLLAKEQSLHVPNVYLFLNVLRLTWPARAGHKLTTSRLLS
jgi:hypothetical protein